jgi:hypothetical protein
MSHAFHQYTPISKDVVCPDAIELRNYGRWLSIPLTQTSLQWLNLALAQNLYGYG